MTDTVFWWTGLVAWSVLAGAVGAVVVAASYDAVCAGIVVWTMARVDPPRADRTWTWIARKTWKMFAYCWWRHPTFLLQDGSGRELAWPGIMRQQAEDMDDD